MRTSALNASYLSLECANQQALEYLSRLVAVSDIFERLGCILATDVD